jgi:hypothetical protein
LRLYSPPCESPFERIAMSCVGRRQDARPEAYQRRSQLWSDGGSIWQRTCGNEFVKKRSMGGSAAGPSLHQSNVSTVAIAPFVRDRIVRAERGLRCEQK